MIFAKIWSFINIKMTSYENDYTLIVKNCCIALIRRQKVINSLPNTDEMIKILIFVNFLLKWRFLVKKLNFHPMASTLASKI